VGIQAAYTTVDTAELDRLVELPSDDLVDAVEALETAGAPTLYLDKMWDGLHFLMTGASASSPIEGDPLSEAVVGVHVFDADDFVGCTEVDELPGIVAALEAVSLAALLQSVDFSAFARADIYPNAWADEPAALGAELSRAFTELLDFHRAALAAERHVIVSIL
jgi:hypothetical protein